ncbi:MAG: DUF6754 domain-containing protein [Planctomycetota bacterium]
MIPSQAAALGTSALTAPAWPSGFGTAAEISQALDVAAHHLAPWVNTGKLPTLIAIVVFAWVMFASQRKARRGVEIPIRRLAGLDALDEAIGRATEMGRPVLYVPGTDEIKEIQTIYSMMILRHVARKTAEYGTPLIVPTKNAVVMAFAEEAVKQGCVDAGRPEAFIADNVRYLSDEQFAYCAGIAGIMYRERPAANIYMGMFFAESLILAETGFLHGAIQVAGTAKQEQLPFFVAACDYTIMGEEYYAVTAYLTRDPGLLGTIRAGDQAKLAAAALFLIGITLATVGDSTAAGPSAASIYSRLFG